MILYIDPGSGSIVLQMLIAAVTGIIFVLVRIRTQIKLFFDRIFSKSDKPKIK
jgi:hypothetical protein